jgi:hypothetical protein
MMIRLPENGSEIRNENLWYERGIQMGNLMLVMWPWFNTWHERRKQ